MQLLILQLINIIIVLSKISTKSIDCLNDPFKVIVFSSLQNVLALFLTFYSITNFYLRGFFCAFAASCDIARMNMLHKKIRDPMHSVEVVLFRVEIRFVSHVTLIDMQDSGVRRPKADDRQSFPLSVSIYSIPFSRYGF
jgi:hypothetical protein